jgi:hypothetical protein
MTESLRQHPWLLALVALSSCAPGWQRPWTHSITRTEVRQCSYSVGPMQTTPIVGALSEATAREWLAVSARDVSQRCPVQLARVQPDWSQQGTIPSLDALRTFVRARTTTRVGAADDEPLSSDTLFDWQQLFATLDGAQLRAHLVARALARNGINVHKLFAMGPLVLRQGEHRYYPAPFPSWSDAQRFSLPFRWTSERPSLAEPLPGLPMPRMVLYRPAPVVVVRVTEASTNSFACPDASDRRCELRVIDPALRPTILDRRTDEALGLLTVAQWLFRMRPTDEGPEMGVSLELARRTQVLPATLHGRGGPFIVELGDDHPCPISANVLRDHLWIEGVRRPGLMDFLQRRVFSVHRVRFRQYPSDPEKEWGLVVVEGVDEPIVVRARDLEPFERAAHDGTRVDVQNRESGMRALPPHDPSRAQLACDLSSVAAIWMRGWEGPWTHQRAVLTALGY